MSKSDSTKKHIDSLDGVRALSIMLVSWFHLWELSWLTPYVKIENKILNSFGLYELNFHTLVRFGFTGVDFLILLSAVVNFLPYAKAIVYHKELPDTKEYYIKRAVRIIPSYYFCLITMLIISLATHNYKSPGFLAKDFITHLTFTGIFFKDVYTSTSLNGVLWTLQLEVLYYLLIPFIAKAFKRAPAITSGVMLTITLLSSKFMAASLVDALPYNNFFITFIGFYACGLLIAVIYYTFEKNQFTNKYIYMGAIICLIFSYLTYEGILQTFYDKDRFHTQLSTRFILMLCISLIIMSCMLLPDILQRILGNKIFKFISLISYNLFIWHQQVFRFLREYRIPKWTGDEYPNITGDRNWQIRYTILSIIISILVALLVTYAIEKPIGNFLFKRFLGKQKETTVEKEASSDE